MWFMELTGPGCVSGGGAGGGGGGGGVGTRPNESTPKTDTPKSNGFGELK